MHFLCIDSPKSGNPISENVRYARRRKIAQKEGIEMGKRSCCLFAVLMMAICLTACGATDTKPEDSRSTTPPATMPQPSETENVPPFTETVFVDDANCTFKVTAIKDDRTFGYTLKAFLENKTDKNLMFSLDNVSVNGYMCDPFWAATVASGMKANDDISFSHADLETNGITQVTDVTFTLRIYDSDNWAADPLFEESFTLYPLGESAVTPHTRIPQAGETVLFDDTNCTMIITGFHPDSTWGYEMTVYLENKTDKDLMFSVSNASVNGYMCDPLWAVSVAAGKRSNTSITWPSSKLEDNGITEVTSIVLPILVYDENDWTADSFIEESFTVKPNN